MIKCVIQLQLFLLFNYLFYKINILTYEHINFKARILDNIFFRFENKVNHWKDEGLSFPILF